MLSSLKLECDCFERYQQLHTLSVPEWHQNGVLLNCIRAKLLLLSATLNGLLLLCNIKIISLSWPSSLTSSSSWYMCMIYYVSIKVFFIISVESSGKPRGLHSPINFAWRFQLRRRGMGPNFPRTQLWNFGKRTNRCCFGENRMWARAHTHTHSVNVTDKDFLTLKQLIPVRIWFVSLYIRNY